MRSPEENIYCPDKAYRKELIECHRRIARLATTSRVRSDAFIKMNIGVWVDAHTASLPVTLEMLPLLAPFKAGRLTIRQLVDGPAHSDESAPPRLTKTYTYASLLHIPAMLLHVQSGIETGGTYSYASLPASHAEFKHGYDAVGEADYTALLSEMRRGASGKFAD